MKNASNICKKRSMHVRYCSMDQTCSSVTGNFSQSPGTIPAGAFPMPSSTHIGLSGYKDPVTPLRVHYLASVHWSWSTYSTLGTSSTGIGLLVWVLFSLWFLLIFILFLLPRCMKCRHGLAMRILSVCLSVRQTRYCSRLARVPIESSYATFDYY